MRDVVKQFRGAVTKAKKGWTQASLIVSDDYPEWKVDVLKWMQEQYSAGGGFSKLFMKDLKTWAGKNVKDKKLMSETMKFASFIKKETEDVGPVAMEVQLPFDQTATLEEVSAYIIKQANIPQLTIIKLGSEEAAAVPERTADNSSPGSPASWFH